MYSRLLKAPADKSYFLLGPRGTGKSFWVRHLHPQAVHLDLLESELFTSLMAAPQRLAGMIPKDFKGHVIIDEVQRVPDLLNEVHRLIEKRKLRFVLTGSSARKLRKGGVNLLAGRALHASMHPLAAIELGPEFKLSHAIKYGLLPSAWVDQNPRAYLASYVRAYLQEEVIQEGLTRSLSAFTRFLEVASLSQAEVLSVSSVARDAGVERKTVENYFSILDDLLIGIQLPVFTKKAKRRMTTHPKFYFFDAGVYRAIRPRGPLDIEEDLEGKALETLVLSNLRAVNDGLNLGYSLHFWRSSSQQEVDFVLYGERGLMAFEVKRASKLRSEDFKGLHAFLEDYPMAKGHLIYGGTRRQHQEGVELIPITEALLNLPEILGA